MNIDELLPYLEENLDNIPTSAEFDNIRQGLIILIGTLARHLDNYDIKIRKTVSRLIEALSTPSQQVLFFKIFFNFLILGSRISSKLSSSISAVYKIRR